MVYGSCPVFLRPEKPDIEKRHFSTILKLIAHMRL